MTDFGGSDNQSEPLELNYGDTAYDHVKVGVDAEGYALAIRHTTAGWRFSHVCDSPRRGMRLRIAPLLSNVGQPGGHQIVNESPLHIEPSILCEDCGIHGFVRLGKWVSA